MTGTSVIYFIPMGVTMTGTVASNGPTVHPPDDIHEDGVLVE